MNRGVRPGWAWTRQVEPHRRQRFRLLLAAVLVCLGTLPDRLPARADEPWNILLICVDDLRPELNCFGQSHIRSPAIDRLAARGRIFQRHYVQAPTCGASRYSLLTGRYGPAGNEALFQRARELVQSGDHPGRGAVPPTMPEWFRQQGYRTVSVGKVSHHPGGRGGPDWDDDAVIEIPGAWDLHLQPVGPWQHPRGVMHGLAHGEIRKQPGQMALFQATPGPDSIYPDGLTTDEALRQLDQLAEKASDQPFFLAVGLLRPHLPLGAPAKYLEPYLKQKFPPISHPEKPAGRTTWHKSDEFMKYNRWGKDPNRDPEFADEVRRHYAACVSYADAQVEKLLDRLDQLQLTRRTIVVLWGDHGWHLGEHAIWGKHSLFEESLRAPLIVAYPGIPQAGQATSAIVETIDLFPTLCDLAGLPAPDSLDGTSLRPQLENPVAEGRFAISYASARTIRTSTHRLIQHRDGYLELYDHRSAEGETRNRAADSPEIVSELIQLLKSRPDRR